MIDDWLTKALAIQDPLRRKLFVAGVLQESVAREGRKCVVVGGTAVAWYTQGLYQSADVDVLCNWAALDRLLERLGFEREGRYWVREDIGILIEAPAEALEAYRDRTVTVEVEGAGATVICVEEAILDRLRACVHWKSALDCEQALQMMAIHRDTIDWPYLEKRAVRDQVVEKLAETRKRAESIED